MAETPTIVLVHGAGGPGARSPKGAGAVGASGLRQLGIGVTAAALTSGLVRDSPRLTQPPAHRVSGAFRSGSVIAPMPAGRDPADHELGREAGQAWADRAAQQAMKGARFMTNDEPQAMVRDELKPLAAYFEDLKARLDAYSERELDEMDKYQNRKAV